MGGCGSRRHLSESGLLSEGPIRRGAPKIAFPGWIVRMHDALPLENFPGRH